MTPPTTAPRTSFATAVARIFDLSLGEMIWSRRTILLLLLVGAPIVLAVVIRLLTSASAFGAMHVNGVAVGGRAIFDVMVGRLFVRFVVPVLGILYGTALIADEVEDRTITYLFTRPIAREAVLVGKYVAYLVCTILFALPAVLIVYFVLVPTTEIGATFLGLLLDLGLIAIGLAVYGALFAWVGARLKRPLVIGLLFIFGWEPVVMIVPGYLRHFTVAYYLEALAPFTVAPDSSAMSLLQSLLPSAGPGVAASLLILAGILLVSLALAGRAVANREYILEP
jgi:ABC-type transport system involved in multi-copper enzyme maturation permease subunit